MDVFSSNQLRLVTFKAKPGAADSAVPRRIAVLALPNTALSDIAGPYEAFLAAGRLGQERLRTYP